jgi:hypothetical protein
MLTLEQERLFDTLVKLTESRKSERISEKRDAIQSQILISRKQLMSNMGFSEYIKFMAYAGILLT